MRTAWSPALGLLLAACSQDLPLRLTGDPQVWSPLTLTLSGPVSAEDGLPNPFLDYRLDVAFTHEDGTSLVIPGYFCADGRAADSGATSGDCWRAHVLPPKAGSWKLKISFRSGPRVALASDPFVAGDPLPGDGFEATLRIAEVDSSKPRPRGKLLAVGARYLRFAGDGSWFLKGGTDSPENFLAYAGFDGAEQTVAGDTRPGEAQRGPRHRYEPHLRDWRLGDPTWGQGRGRSIIGALNYLAEQGVNSVYMITMNLYGDGDDVWPYTSPRERYRFDCSKLDQWEVVFQHMDRLGIMQHIILTEAENESLFEVEEGGGFADSRRLYYRELIARFSHHPALVWNLGEENGGNDGDWNSGSPQRRGNTDEQRKAFAAFIRELDPYDSPIVVHTHPEDHERIYSPLLGLDTLDGVSLQIADRRNVYRDTLEWVRRSAAAGHPWFVALDEIGPPDEGVAPDSVDPEHDDVRQYALWGNLMAGGAGCEWYFGYRHPHNDLGLEDFRSRHHLWRQTAAALQFFHQHLPFWQMEPATDRVVDPDLWCLAEDDRLLVLYVPPGRTAQVLLGEGAYSVQWFDPRNGGAVRSGSQSSAAGPGLTSLGAPPDTPERDWVILLRKLP
jgi:hypothetical protein